MIDPTDLKYFKLAVGKLAKESKDDCSVNCIECGDKKQRLHLYQNPNMEIALVHCYNAGCTFDDNQMGMVKFLKQTRAELVPQYKMERFRTNMDAIKENAESGELSLDDILARAKAKKAGTPVEDKPTKNKQDDFGVNTGLFSSDSTDDIDIEVEEVEEVKNTSEDSGFNFDFKFTESDFGNDTDDATKTTSTTTKPTKPTKQTVETTYEDDGLEDELGFIKKVIKPTSELPEGSTAMVVPELFTKKLLPCRAVPEAVEYIESRGLTVGDNWLFSKDKFINIFDKPYYVLNFIFIPLFQNGKLRGFYTRSIEEKRFSTIVFPKGEKYWSSETIDPTKTCYIFEGIFDAMSSGFENVCAMLSADLPQEFLEELEDPVFCFDNDETGIKKALKYNKLGFKTFVWLDIPEKDMNERLKSTSIDANKMMIEHNVFKGLEAKIKLSMIRV